MRYWIVTLVCALGLSVLAIAGQRGGPARHIIKVSDSCYRVRNGQWYGLFYVTPEGIVLVDPISTDVAAWLKTQLADRFPGVPVRYVIYSHSHWDHIEGGAAFAETAKFVAQE